MPVTVCTLRCNDSNVAFRAVARWGHSRFELLVQISHFSSANFSAKSRLPYPARLSNAHAHELHLEQVAGVSACRDIGSEVRTGNPIYYGGPGVQ